MKKKAPLGQNFLTDAAAIRRIVEGLGDVRQRLVLEIGPGRGALTRPLAEVSGRLIAIELDRSLAARLRMDFARRSNVEILEADVLKVDFDTLVHGALRGVSGLPQEASARAIVVGNLPYYITSEILLRLFAFHHDFERIVLMVQREVADRLCAKPGTRDYGLLTLTTKLYADAVPLFTLPPGAFSPPPKVHSTVLALTVAPKAKKLGVEPGPFLGFLRLCFAQKRKMLTSNLKPHFKDVAEALEKTKLPPKIRAEAVSLEKMAVLFRGLCLK